MSKKLTKAPANVLVNATIKVENKRGLKVSTVNTRKGLIEIKMTVADYKTLLLVAGRKSQTGR